jgi:hypothetical protein
MRVCEAARYGSSGPAAPRNLEAVAAGGGRAVWPTPMMLGKAMQGRCAVWAGHRASC